jgi:hypothetical protein
MRKTLALIAAVLAALAVAGPASASPKGEVARRCPDTVRGAAYYRAWTWRWQDRLHVRRQLHSYRRGRPVQTCARARQLARTWQRRAELSRRRANYLEHHIRAAIRWVFGPELGPGAIVVAECETGHLLDNREAALQVRLGQYVGIFQLSDRWEIQRWGRWRGTVRYATVLDQVWAARRMWRDRTWQAWACRPDGSVAY